jgi:hypothetical protein
MEIEKSRQDHFVLSPLELLQKHGTFPWSLIFHTSLLVLTTLQVLLIVTNQTEATRLQEHLFYNLFLEESNKAVDDFDRFVYLFTVPEIKDHMRWSINVYKI